MRQFLLTRKTKGLTKRLLNSQQNHHHRGSSSDPPFSRTPNLTIGSKSIMLSSYVCRSLQNIRNLQPPSSSFFSCSYATTRTSRLDGLEEENENTTKKVDLEIISREIIKPASPTPNHLRTFSFSIFDQFFDNCYTPLTLFLPNTDHFCVANVITERSKILKNSLSKLLTRYYPFAGEIKDDLHIECNDKGVYFVEARVNQTLYEFLRQPHDHKVKDLIPKHPSDTEASSANHVVLVQVNIFNCGGIALSMKLSHKIIDGGTFFTFLNAWADSARGLPEKIAPSFVASEIFPNNPNSKYSMPSKLMTSKPLATKRFVFDSIALFSLKNKLVLSSRGPTRMEAIGALIWKAAANAASTIRPFGPQSPHALFSVVNFRKRASPSLPKEAIGNLCVSRPGVCLPYGQPDLLTLTAQIRESIAKINPEFIDSLKGEKGHETFDWLMKKGNELYDVMDEGDGLVLTSLLNSGIYEIDFGWGKPIWFYYVNPGFSRMVVLNDMVKGGGVETIVTLSPEEMKTFERDPELLSYACTDPTPLHFLDSSII